MAVVKSAFGSKELHEWARQVINETPSEEPRTMLKVWLEPVACWDLWPLYSKCLCENSEGTKVHLPFFYLYIAREKVSA